MTTVLKNLVVGGVDIQLKQHNSKGFMVKFAHNLHFNNGFIFGENGKSVMTGLIADEGATNHDNQLQNKFTIP